VPEQSLGVLIFSILANAVLLSPVHVYDVDAVSKKNMHKERIPEKMLIVS
jgi:hypothetical protein